MGEWIEMIPPRSKQEFTVVSPFMGEWIEIRKILISVDLPVTVSLFMGEWIEINLARRA